MSAAKRRVTLTIGALTLLAHPTVASRGEDVSALSGGRMNLHKGTLHITEDNAIVRNVEVRGDVVVDADNVSMRNVRILSTTLFSALRIKDGADGFILADSEIDGGGATANAIDGYGTFLRNRIHGAENGINVTGPSLIKANHIYGLLNRHGSPHYDGIQVDGGHDIAIVGNTIINENTQTSAIMLDNYFEGLSNVTVEGNRLIGGGYTIYVDGRFEGGAVVDSTIRIINNHIEGGFYGNYVFYDHKPVFYGNTLVEPPKARDKSASNPE